MLIKSKNKNILALFFICLATSLFTLDMGIIAISLDEISSNFSTEKHVTAWIITIFSITSAIGILTLGFLSKTFGRKNVYTIGVLGFSFFSALCGLSQSFEQIIIYRSLQGFFGPSKGPITGPAKRPNVQADRALLLNLILNISKTNA